jgi:hypothetical protein
MSPDPGPGEIAERLDIAQIWRVLGLPGESGKCVCSPFREDKRASFSVYKDASGRSRWRDHATGGHGDSLDFLCVAKGCDSGEALRWARDFLGIGRKPEAAASTKTKWFPDLRRGAAAELNVLAEGRGFGVDAMREAEGRGLFGFAEFAGTTCWAVRDRRRQLMELRRLDGRFFEAYKNLPARKSHCIGSGKAWPLGIEEAVGFEKIAWLEGAPDFVAAFNFLLAEGKKEAVAPVAMLGAANHRIAPEALGLLKSKVVVLYPHVDDRGQAAAVEWARQLAGAGAEVQAFDMSGIVMVDGKPGKDLADVCRISAECFEAERKFREVLP